MRRLTLAALSAALALSACSDERQSPTEPDVPPSAEFSTTCTVTRFPLSVALNQIKTVFPSAPLRSEASLRAGAIALLWNTCNANLAQAGALDFVKWMSRQTLPTSKKAKAAQSQLIVTMLSGVGLLTLPSTATEGPDFGIGGYDPTKTTDQFFTTAGGTATTKLPPGAFTEFTTIVISRRADASQPLDFDGQQFPPFFDYDAINASGNHFFENGVTATIAFCQLPETEGFQYPEFADIKIGHNKPARLTPPEPAAFELLDPETVPADLAALLDCDNLETASANFGLLHNLARATGRSLAPIARALFMPAPLHAATIAVGYLGPISTKPGSFSPFGIVEFTEGTGTSTSIDSDTPDPSNEGEAISVSFSVSPEGESAFAPTGNVTVSDGNGASCTATIDVGDCSLTPVGVGTITLTAVYEGDENFAGSSDTEGHTVLVAPGINAFGVNSGDDGLSTINLTTGVSSFIGRLGGADLNLYATPIAMGVQPSDGALYVWNNSNDAVPNPISTGVLLRVNPNTGQATPVNSDTGPQGGLQALAFTPGGEVGQADTLYGVSSELVQIDLATGAIDAIIGSIGLNIGGADIDCGGTLYGVELTAPDALTQKLVTIDRGNGTVLTEATLSQDIGTIGSIVFLSSGVLVGSALNGDLGDILFDINKSTGVVSNVRLITGGTGPQGLGVARSCNIIN
jgi:hypothetical protein